MSHYTVKQFIKIGYAATVVVAVLALIFYIKTVFANSNLKSSQSYSKTIEKKQARNNNIPILNVNSIIVSRNTATISNLSEVGSMLQSQPVLCQTFDDGYSRMSGLSDAIYVKGDSSLCTPGSGAGTCRKWFGRCVTTGSSRLNVVFKVYDDGDINQTNLSDAVYIRRPNISCTPGENCRRWFGLPQAQDGRAVVCRLFDDGYTNMTAPTRSIYYRSPGQVCMPGEVCRKWFGRCEVANGPPPPRPTRLNEGDLCFDYKRQAAGKDGNVGICREGLTCKPKTPPVRPCTNWWDRLFGDCGRPSNIQSVDGYCQ